MICRACHSQKVQSEHGPADHSLGIIDICNFKYKAKAEHSRRLQSHCPALPAVGALEPPPK